MIPGFWLLGVFSMRSIGTIVFIFLTASAANVRAVTIDTVPIGNPGNAPSSVGYGSVGYDYRMSTYEVTNDQYVEFLNAKGHSDSPLLYPTVTFGGRAGIVRSGVNGSYTYSAAENMGNKPVNFVGWFQAARFANWMNNGQGNGDTETGAYTITNLGPGNPYPVTRNAGATWVIPTANEWYKAAYYDPRSAAQGGPALQPNYWTYATKSEFPLHVFPPFATANSVGDISNPGPGVINHRNGADWNGYDGNVTTVGSAGPLSTSFYGTYDQSGNVWEWTEQFSPSVVAALVLGGGWGDNPQLIQSINTYQSVNPVGDFSWNFVGFRLAFIPEPSSFALAAIGLIGLAAWGWRRRNR
jgi:formylglycine-generating enzyme